MSWGEWLGAQARAREEAGLRRSLRARGANEPLLDLAGNDYLGLSRHPAVCAAAAEAVHTWGAGAGASRLVTGTLGLHQELERALAAFMGQHAALVFSTGYHANLSVVTALADRETLIVSDAHVHASLIDAARLARAAIRVVPHNDTAAVERELAAAAGRRALVLCESVYSVLGDAAPLAELATATARHDALLVVDEAHALGVAGRGGRGLLEAQGLAGREEVIVTATLSKALGAQGGAVLGTPQLIEQLVNCARPFIFDTGLAPAATAGALAALGLLQADPQLPARIAARVAALAARLGLARPAGAVLSVPMPSPQAALAAQASALAAGVRVGCFRPPSTPDAVSRLRITASAGITEGDWQRAVGIIARVVEEHAAKDSTRTTGCAERNGSPADLS